MVHYAELCVIAHEYAHIVNGDVDEYPQKLWEDIARRGDKVSQKRDAEFAAYAVAGTFNLGDKDWSGKDEAGRNEARAVSAGACLILWIGVVSA
jgi:hypothetical protein